ncbi:hypothetical protein Halru_0709 [Halovivax ruber XH-70]|uniref:Uncharacterized protein n=1 Tax=Halovivax ruber (strain DSM 18193 / JCM 13892 / XH-70) TaxID=797302 RepID=L0IAU1_HALRX|nr:hypothetical protein [Halovivax ruber]AGB15336.1 hypothetical protein Halru_0709 [Halovivax ruber XH-70]
MPSRRRVLGTVAAGLCATLAGCIDATGVLQMDEATTDELLDPATVEVGRTGEERDIVVDVLDTGSATVSGERPPLGVDQPVTYDGAVYELARTETGDRTRTDYRVVLETDPGAADTADRQFDTLPGVDAERLEPLLAERTSGDDAVGADLSYTESERAESAIVPDPDFDVLAVDGDRFGVAVEPIETTVTTYEYTLVDELGSEGRYADELAADHRFDLAGLSDAERDVVEEAIDEGGYYADSTDDEAFEGVARTFFDHDPFASDDDRAYWIATYEGTTYVAMVDPIRWRDLRRDVPAAE